MYLSLTLISAQSEDSSNDTLSIEISEDILALIREKQLSDLEEKRRLIRDENAYINGQEFYVYYNPTKSSPLLRFSEERNGSLYISGQSFDDLIIHYDTYRDRIILYRIVENAVLLVELNSEYIDSLQLNFQDESIKLKKMKFVLAGSNEIVEGFFEVVFNGQIKYILKHISKPEIINSIDYYSYQPEEYLLYQNKLFQVRSKRSLVKVFPEKFHKDLRTFMRRNNIKIKRNETDPDILTVIQYFDSIK